MEFVRKGKTKDVYRCADGNICLRFKDTVTGDESGKADSGGNLVVGEVKGVGTAALAVSAYYFELLKKHGIPTHYISSDQKKGEMVVRPVQMIGNGLEFVVRYKASGSFVRRFSEFIKEGAKLDALFEVTLKDDSKNDPPVTRDILDALGLLTKPQYDEAEILTKKVCKIIYDGLAQKGLELIDIKIELAFVNGKLVVIDEVSAGNMRVQKNGKPLGYLELTKELVAEK